MGAVLAGSQNAVFLFPDVGTSGGMTYRPQEGASEAVGIPNPDAAGSTPTPPASGVEQSEARQPHKLEAEGSSPSAATICPMLTKSGDECLGFPTSTGYCMAHSRQIGEALGELL